MKSSSRQLLTVMQYSMPGQAAAWWACKTSEMPLWMLYATARGTPVTSAMKGAEAVMIVRTHAR